MSWVTLDPQHERPGHLVCACDLTPPSDAGVVLTAEPGLAVAAVIFGLTVLAQTLTTAVLPLAGGVLAPQQILSTLPYALTLVGAGLATLPAAMLTDLFGRRAALALGASLGLAGGAIAARSYMLGQFSGLALGALWLGVAQGFGYFYRHTPVMRAGDKPRAIALVLGSGAFAALLAPLVVTAAQSLAGPLAPAAALMAAGALQVVILVLALSMRHGVEVNAAVLPQPIGARRFAAATLAGAAAWFGMTWIMADAAPAMAICGLGAATASGLIASHVLWMYAPAALAGPWLRRLGGGRMAALGLMMIFAAMLVFTQARSALPFAALLALAGSGWSLSMLGATLTLHAQGAPARRMLALHDAALFAAAVAGALAGGLLR